MRRYGQVRVVNVWRFLTRGTIDVEVFEGRTGRKVEVEVEVEVEV